VKLVISFHPFTKTSSLVTVVTWGHYKRWLWDNSWNLW